MSTLREAAQAAPDAEVRAQHKEFARWFLELSDKSALASEYLAWLAWKAALAHPPRNEWREAVHDELVTTWTLSAENKDDPRKALQDIINWHVRVSLDPAVSSDAQALIERGKAMRDVTPPTESPIAAKCQRIEGSGEICGLTPPCPDCGSSLIDVPEGSL